MPAVRIKPGYIWKENPPEAFLCLVLSSKQPISSVIGQKVKT